ncbi:1,4-alpha-glucan branching enzyme GlgB [Labeo rohita]|uniref:1,4-alpha-glucan branching enzyme GlgB n=1 Tax=Labeo rohita TaxID=84645 RepID=A0ABQ8L1Q3_LABRO|nr:1,4-alpha-glucan branching enzyme GlgB [Labeo rohita]
MSHTFAVLMGLFHDYISYPEEIMKIGSDACSTESEAELAAMVLWAAKSIELEVPKAPSPERSRLNDWFLGAGSDVPPRSTLVSFFPEDHEELTKMWWAPYTASSHLSSSLLTTDTLMFPRWSVQLWCTCDAEKVRFLDAPISQAGLFGNTVEDFGVQKQTEAIKHILPRCESTKPPGTRPLPARRRGRPLAASTPGRRRVAHPAAQGPAKNTRKSAKRP